MFFWTRKGWDSTWFTTGLWVTKGYRFKMAWIVKLARPKLRTIPLSLQSYNIFQPIFDDCLFTSGFSSPSGASPSWPSAGGAGGGLVGQLSMTRSKYSSFMATWYAKYLWEHAWYFFQYQEYCLLCMWWTSFPLGKLAQTDLEFSHHLSLPFAVWHQILALRHLR